MVETFAAVEREFGALDIVFNNAGINNVLNEGLKNWQGMLAVNVGGRFHKRLIRLAVACDSWVESDRLLVFFQA